MGKTNCLKCNFSDIRSYIRNNTKCKKVRCNNKNSKFYKHEFITSEEFEVTSFGECDKMSQIDLDNPESYPGEKIKVNLRPIIEHDKGSIVLQNDRDRFINILNTRNCTSFEEILNEYIDTFGDKIHANQCCAIIRSLSDILYSKIENLNNIKNVSKERAKYLKQYLDGKLYTDKDAAIKHIDIQKENAQAIIDVCNN